MWLLAQLQEARRWLEASAHAFSAAAALGRRSSPAFAWATRPSTRTVLGVRRPTHDATLARYCWQVSTLATSNVAELGDDGLPAEQARTTDTPSINGSLHVP